MATAFDLTEYTAEQTPPRIYVACLAAYNNGILHGTWIDAAQEPWAIWADVSAMLARSPMPGTEEYAIHDYEGFGGLRLEEYTGIERVAALAAFIMEHGALGAALLDEYGGDLDEASDALADRYLGRYDSLADYAQELTEATVSIPEALRYYIDYAAMGRDFALSGDVLGIEVDGALHLFATR